MGGEEGKGCHVQGERRSGRVSEFSTLLRQGTVRMRIDHEIRERCAVMMIKRRSEYISGIAVIVVKVSGGSSTP